MTAPFSLPVIRLKPKANARAIRHGFPWVYADELVTDRRTKALAPGALCVLEDSERQGLGLFAVNPLSKIIARRLDDDPGAVIDRGEGPPLLTVDDRLSIRSGAGHRTDDRRSRFWCRRPVMSGAGCDSHHS